eukprot:3511328-Karenia_brevis.AAC.1
MVKESELAPWIMLKQIPRGQVVRLVNPTRMLENFEGGQAMRVILQHESWPRAHWCAANYL